MTTQLLLAVTAGVLLLGGCSSRKAPLKAGSYAPGVGQETPGTVDLQASEPSHITSASYC